MCAHGRAHGRAAGGVLSDAAASSEARFAAVEVEGEIFAGES